MKRIAILGGGSWGTALSIVFSRAYQPHDICLWVRDPALAARIKQERENKVYLPDCAIPAAVAVTSNLEFAAGQAQIIVCAVPAAYTRDLYKQLIPLLAGRAAGKPSSKSKRDVLPILVSATKGLEPSTHLRISEVIAKVIGETFSPKFAPKLAVLSGPSFAAEVARGEPTAVVIASKPNSTTQKRSARAARASRAPEIATTLQEEFAAPNFRLYTNDDVLGVELAGAMKNVIAIAAGACQGLGLGANSLAALITRGLAEMSRLALAVGAKPETLGGLAGLGDLVLTCTGSLSRNRRVGIELGKGRALFEILADMRMVAEGVGTAAALLELARAAKIEMPVTAQVNALLHHGKSPRDAIREIMERPQRSE